MKKNHWHAFWHEKLFEKHPQSHCQTRSYCLILLFPQMKRGIDHESNHICGNYTKESTSKGIINKGINPLTL